MESSISLNDRAPSEAVHFSLGQVEFDLSGNKTFKTDDPIAIANAEAHPWLTVKRPQAAAVYYESPAAHVKAEDDPLSSLNTVAFDPEEIAKVEDAKKVDGSQPVAIEAGLEQTEVVESAGVAETLAADDSTKTSDKTKDKN